MTTTEDNSTAAGTPEPNSIGIKRHFTTEGVHPYDTVVWGLRDALIVNYKTQEVAFEQKGVEFPLTWSVNASNIVAQKYFRGPLGSPKRERSFKQVVDRVVDTITRWGISAGYFVSDDEAQIFSDELKFLMVHQMASFNSPVWFNIGAEGRTQQASACFILDVEDTMDSIKEWSATEIDIFRGGSGSGANISRIREDKAPLSRGGKASGPVSFMRYTDSGAGAVKSAGETRRAAKMVILNADHPDIELFIWCKAIEERKARVLRDAGFDMDLDGKDSSSVQYQNANNSVRVTDEFMKAVIEDRDWHLISRVDGSITKTVKARDLMMQIAQAAHECADPGMQFHTTINRWNTTPTLEELDGSNPCSEHIRRRNSSCNLASLNLLKFLQEDGRYDLAAYQAAIEMIFTAQDILIEGGEFPTEKIKEVTHNDRDLGLGYANLGALLMAMGLPYDSDKGRAVAAVVSGLLTSTAYRRSSRMAARLGSFPSFAGDREGAISVMRMHLEKAFQLQRTISSLGMEDMLGLSEANITTWEQVVEGVNEYGLRNAQATVIAPTGTISFMMDCDTTSMEPDLGLKKTKKLVGGGTLSMVNQTVPRALRSLSYSETQIESIVTYIDNHSSVLGSPDLKTEHLPVFACSMGDNFIDSMGHVKMMGAIQPGIAGALSKTVNLPGSATVQDVYDVYLQAWLLGVKCLAVYVDNSKVGQPLAVSRKEVDKTLDNLEEEMAGTPELVAEMERLRHQIAELTVKAQEPVRTKMQNPRQGQTMGFTIGEADGYFTVNVLPDGRPGEIFIKMGKQGGTITGLLDTFSIQTSMAWQYGVPLKTMVEKFINQKFEPAGMVGKDSEIKMASSIIDYIFRRLALWYLPKEVCDDLNIKTIGARAKEVELAYAPSPKVSPSIISNVLTSENRVPSSDAPYCYQCGVQMQRAGSCFACPSCGSTSGCS